ncbi:MAG: hypothetical protein ACI4J3_08585 [Oscillospiraceae bacterium]
MKKRFLTFIVLLCGILTACQTATTSNESQTATAPNESTGDTIHQAEGMIPTAQIIETAQEEFDAIKTNSVSSNLDFTNATLQLPDQVEDVYALQISQGDILQKQLMELFYRTTDALFTETNSQQEELYFFNIRGGFPQMSDDGVGAYPMISDGDNQNKLQNESIPLGFYLFQTDTYEVHDLDEYLLMFDDLQLIKMNLGNCMRSVDKNRRIAGWMPKDDFVVRQILAPDSTERYALCDGEVAINQAVQFCEEYFLSAAPYREVITALPKVHAVELLEIDAEHYGYLMLLSRSYAGIPFDSLHFEGMVSDFSDGNEYLFDNSELLMVESDEIEYCYISYLADTITTIGDPIDQMISLKTAAATVGEMMTERITFQVNQISLVYSNKQSTEDGVISTAEPAWRFELYNDNDARTYVVMIHAQNRDGYYYCY